MSGGYDYASDLVRSPASKTTVAPPPAQPAAAPAPHDYASEVLSPGGDTFARNVSRIPSDLGGGASFGSLVKSGMVDDQKTKMRLMAESIFPGEPDAVERFGEMNGEIVYVGKDEKLHKAETSGVKSFAANLLGNAPTIAGGAAGAILGAGASPAGSIGLGALGAAGGKGIQEIIANLGLGEPQTVGGNIGGMAKEAAFAGVGGAGGALFQKFMQRNMARDISKLDPAAVAGLDQKAAAQGVTLNAAQRTNVPSLKNRAEALSRIPASADDMNASLEATRQQASDAADRFVASISPVNGLDEAGTKARDASKAVIAALTNERSAQARPLYKKAFTDFQEFSEPQLDRLAQLRESPTFKDAEKVATRLLKDDLATMGEQEMPQAGALRDLHYTKLALDKLIGDSATGGYQKTSRNAIINLKNELLKVMDDASPSYKEARQVFAHMSPNIESVKDGVISKIADLSDEQALKASKLMFNPQMSPTAIGRARVLFHRSGMQDDWNAMLRGYLQDTLETAGKEFKSGPGTGRAVTWRYTLVGDPKQASNLKAAMSHDQWNGFQDMMEVFEAVGRVKGTGNSITMPMQEASSEIQKEAGKGVLSTVMQPRQALIDWLAEARQGKHAAKQVEILNDPNALKRLKELRRLSPNDQQFIQGVSTLLGVTASPE